MLFLELLFVISVYIYSKNILDEIRPLFLSAGK